MRKGSKTLLLSILTLCVCTVLVVGGTYALFSDKVTVNNHLSAGKLQVGLFRTSYKECVLNSDGLMTEGAENTERINLLTDNSVLFNVDKAVPTSWYQTTLEVSNLGSTAFDYGVRIIWKANDNKEDNDEALASQIKITITSAKLSTPIEFMLDKCGENDVSLGYMHTNAKVETFTVKAEFISDSKVNNDAMLASISFDVQVYASQKV